MVFDGFLGCGFETRWRLDWFGCQFLGIKQSFDSLGSWFDELNFRKVGFPAEAVRKFRCILDVFEFCLSLPSQRSHFKRTNKDKCCSRRLLRVRRRKLGEC